MLKQWGPAFSVGVINSLILIWLWGVWRRWSVPVQLNQQLLMVITAAYLLSLVAPFLLSKNFHWQPSKVIWHWMLGWLGYGIALTAAPSWFTLVQPNEIGLGFVFSFVGILCVDAPRNRAVGIRVSWTYASEAVWHQTNRLGGWLLYGSGLVGIGLSAWQPAVGMVLVIMPGLISCGIALVYAYWLSRRTV